MWRASVSFIRYYSFAAGIYFTLRTSSMILDALRFKLNNKLAAAICEALYFKKHDSLCMNLTYCIERSTIYRLVLLSALSSPKSRRNLSRNWIAETERRSKQSVRIISSSKSISFYFFRRIECCSLRMLIILMNDGEMFSSSLAPISMQTAAREIRQGRLRP